MFRRPLTKKQPFGVAKHAVIQAPIRGLRSDEGLIQEQPGAAILMTNWVCEPDAIRVRRGFATHLTGAGSPVESLMVYTSGSTSKMFAALGTAIYDASSAGAIGAAVVSSTTNAYWSYTNFTTAAGVQYIVLANGAIDVREFDGTTWTTPAITGATSADLIYVWQHKQKLWFIEKLSMSAWYLATDAISGAATEFPLGSVFKRGGRLIAGGNWSNDSGDGLDDYIVFVTSEGEVAVYSFTDPSDPTTLLLKGVYYIGKPIGQRCLSNLGGDLLILTNSGLVPLSKAIALDRAVLAGAALTAPIRREFSEYALSYGANQGWEVISFSETNILLINVPEVELSQSRQYVANLNLVPDGWGPWSAVNGFCWAVFNDGLYFGASDGVYEAETGSSDNTAPIAAEVIPAYSQLGYPGLQKHVMMWRPIIRTNAEASGGVQTVVDYNDPTTVPNQGATIDTDAFTWDVSLWDQAEWFGAFTSREWRSGTNIGTAIAPHYAITVTATDLEDDLEFRLIGFDATFKVGNAL